jgi:hypothetical protein
VSSSAVVIAATTPETEDQGWGENTLKKRSDVHTRARTQRDKKMSAVHYKFRSSKDFRTITFDADYIILSELKQAIAAQNRLERSELQIVDAQTGEGWFLKNFYSLTFTPHARTHAHAG